MRSVSHDDEPDVRPRARRGDNRAGDPKKVRVAFPGNHPSRVSHHDGVGRYGELLAKRAADRPRVEVGRVDSVVHDMDLLLHVSELGGRGFRDAYYLPHAPKPGERLHEKLHESPALYVSHVPDHGHRVPLPDERAHYLGEGSVAVDRVDSVFPDDSRGIHDENRHAHSVQKRQEKGRDARKRAGRSRAGARSRHGLSYVFRKPRVDDHVFEYALRPEFLGEYVVFRHENERGELFPVDVLEDVEQAPPRPAVANGVVYEKHVWLFHGSVYPSGFSAEAEK